MASAIKAEVDGAFEEAARARKLAVVCDLNVAADTDFARPALLQLQGEEKMLGFNAKIDQ